AGAKQADDPRKQSATCAAGRNGGATDRGVTANSIGLASTIVTSGPGSTFLGQSQYGMQAVVAKVNAGGGICGRLLQLRLVNDNWEAQRGHGFLRNFVNDKEIFALPVVPSSEGLRAASKEIAEAGIPVIGSDGMLIDQYQNPWIWPVATATVAQVRIMAKYAYDNGARKFAIVYDTHYRFGVEGKDAYESYVKTLPGASFVHAEGIEPNQPGYGAAIANLNRECGESGCDTLVMLVDPGTAEVWIAGDDKFTSRTEHRLGASPLFNDRFGQNCKQRCDGMVVFTGYVPALEGNVNLPGIRTYVQDVKAVQPSADTANQFLQGAYLGMSVFVKALEEVGPILTRAEVRRVMDSMDYSSDLASTLGWRADKRFANAAAQAWRIGASSSFDGFRDLRTGWLRDPLAK
ncbi:MAG: ABC transporter substrate-binding protein, partial [Actinomycetota bacterium]|nr:ABC transporter substrate-binding protein [Actinomycetota bacterium]